MGEDPWIVETYFDWLAQDCFSTNHERREYQGVLRLLHDIPFYWTVWSDENRAGDALSFRKHNFLDFQTDLDRVDQHWLNNWAQSAPSVLEVLLGIARRWADYFEGPIQMYFGHLFRNMGYDRFPGVSLPSAAQERVRAITDDWMTRQYQPDGVGSPFRLQSSVVVINEHGAEIDMTQMDIWSQMNVYSAQHFQ